jgi:hypothetical protein
MHIFDLSINHPDLMAIRHRPETVELTKNVYTADSLINYIPIKCALACCIHSSKMVIATHRLIPLGFLLPP